MTGRCCVVCGRRGVTDEHHPAGRHNDPDTVTDVCRGCHHGYLTPRQRAAGIELRRQASRDEVDMLRARCVGPLEVIEVMWQRDGLDLQTRAGTVQLLGRAFSMLLDLFADRARVGRWTSDPTIELGVADPVEPDADTAAERVARHTIAGGGT